MEKQGQYDRLVEFVHYCEAERGMRGGTFERKAGIGPGYFKQRNRENRKSASPKGLSAATIKKITDAFPELNKEWLISGTGGMLSGVAASVKQPEAMWAQMGGSPYFNVDFIGGFDSVYNDTERVPDGYISMEPFNGDDYLWCNLVGESMSPLIRSGSMICLKRIPNGVEGIGYDGVYALVILKGNGELMRTVKWVTRTDDDDVIRLVPENKDIKYGTYQDVRKSEVLTAFKVVYSGAML